jgi:hypothetical protein
MASHGQRNGFLDPEEIKRAFARTGHRYEDNILMDLKEVKYEDMDWIILSHDRHQ